MPTTSYNVPLPDQLSEYVEAQVRKGEYGTPGEYIRDLIQQDKERRIERLEQQLLVALSDATIDITPEDLTSLSFIESLRAKRQQRS